MKLILEVSVSNDLCSFGCDYALVDLTPELARTMLERIRRFNEAKKVDDEIHEVYYFNRNSALDPVYFSPHPDDCNDDISDLSEAMEQAIHRSTDWTRGPGEWSIPPDDFSVDERMIARTECDQMVIRESEVLYFCYPKHCSDQVLTRAIPLSLIEEVAGVRVAC